MDDKKEHQRCDLVKHYLVQKPVYNCIDQDDKERFAESLKTWLEQGPLAPKDIIQKSLNK